MAYTTALELARKLAYETQCPHCVYRMTWFPGYLAGWAGLQPWQSEVAEYVDPELLPEEYDD